MNTLNEANLVARVLSRLARLVIAHPRWFIYPQILLFILSVLITVRYLEFHTSRSNLVGANKKYHQNFLALKKEFPTQDDLVVVVESDDTEKNRQFVERLGAKLEAETNIFHDVFYKGDLKMLGTKALLFVPESDLLELRKTLQEYRPFIQRFSGTTNLLSLFRMVNAQFRTASREANAENEAMVKALPALGRIVAQAIASLHRSGVPPAPGIDALFAGGEEAAQEIYITFAQGRIYLVTAQAPREELNGLAVDRLRTLVAETKIEVPGLNVGITGEPVLEKDEMEQSQTDTTIASVVSLVLCALIFIYGYQETGRPIKATLCLVVGLGYTMCFATLVVGHLNILTITFVPMLIGLAIDFGVHLITRYEEELRHGKTEAEALTKAMVFTGQGIFTGAFTTACGFMAMGFTNFKGIQEMGIICGGGLLVCLIPMLTLLPALMLRGRQNVIDHIQGDVMDRRARIENIWLNRPIATAVVTLALTVLAASQIPKLYFDYNLLHMQSRDLPAVDFEQKLINSTSKSVLYSAVIATNLQEAQLLQEKLLKLPAVSSIDSITMFLSEDQREKLKIVSHIKQDLRGLRFEEPDRNPVDVPALTRTLYYLYGYLGLASDAVLKDEPAMAREFQRLRALITELRREALSGSLAQREATSKKLAQFQQALFDDVQDTFDALREQDDRAPLRIQDLPDALRNRFIGVTGKYLLMVYPKKDVWQRENQKEFIAQLRTVYPDATGTPVQLYEYTSLLKNSYEDAAKYSLVAIVILVLIHFRSITAVLLALTPVALGTVWLAGLMVAFDVPLNPANIMTLPLVIGIGVTNGIHILNRFAEEQTPSILARSTGKAVLVSGLTTISGFGSLILAEHQGIRSLGYLMATGTATCMIAGLTALPALLNLVGRSKRKRPSNDNARSPLGREEPR